MVSDVTCLQTAVEYGSCGSDNGRSRLAVTPTLIGQPRLGSLLDPLASALLLTLTRFQGLHRDTYRNSTWPSASAQRLPPLLHRLQKKHETTGHRVAQLLKLFATKFVGIRYEIQHLFQQRS